MRQKLFIIAALSLATIAQAYEGAPWLTERNNIVQITEAPCPSFPGIMYPAINYNKGSIPWDLEFYNGGAMSGNTAGAYFQWYRYLEGQPESTATACDWQTDHTTCAGFKPRTDEDNTRYIYFCRVTTTACPEGVRSGNFTVSIGSPNDPCPTFAGTTFSINSGSGSYTSGQTVTLTATTSAYGGEHIYTWYHNGEPLDPDDPRYTFEWGFNDQENPAKLIITNVQPEDGGTYSVVMQDGTECFMYANPVRVLVDAPTCGPVPNLTTAKKDLCAGQNATVTLSNNTLATGEIGTIEYMYQPAGSNPTTTIQNGANNWTTDMPGLYQFKYVVTNPANPSCYRESKVVTIRVYGGGDAPTIVPDTVLIKVQQQLHFTCSAPESGETGKITFTSDAGQSGDIWPNTYPNFAHTCYNPGTYTYTYTLTNSQAGCTRTAQCTVVWYQCEWGNPQWGQWYPSNPTVQVGTAIDLKPSKPTVKGMTCEFTYSLNGGAPVQIDPTQPFTPTAPGTYVFTYAYKHSDPRVTDCYSAITKTFIVESCGTTATLTTDKTTLTLGESATLTYPAPETGETAKLSYTKDGGSGQTMTGTTFSPTTPGSYVVTYSITKTGCGTTSASVTINVYACGPEATLTIDKQSLSLGESVTLTPSAPGADETGTLTYTLNGGTPVSLPAGEGWDGAFTPQAEGTYVFTYTITHAYISCTRSATATLKVYDCGAPAAISADKTIVATGESVQLTLSELGQDKTATLTYSLNGGTPVPLTPNPFIPTEVGTYVITYAVTHTVLDCPTSASVTIQVYACGSEASITLSQEEIKILRQTTITLSAPGENETATLTVQYPDGSKNDQIVNDQMVNVFTPTELGTYVFTYTITHAYLPSCSRTATATLRVIEAELVFDDNNGTHVWSDPKNWWPAYNRLPNIADSAIIRKACTVDIDKAITYDLTFDGASLSIAPTGALVVAHRLLQTSNNSISLLSDASGNGALVLGPENTDVPASIRFYSSAAKMEDLYPVWQYIGSPLKEQMLISAAYPQAMLFEWTNTPSLQYGGNWQRIDSLTGAVAPFNGYCLTQHNTTTYPLQGTLNDPVAKSVAIPYNDQGSYPGFAFVANSWVAPISIAAMEPGDFGAADATVYIMNAGTYDQAIRQQRNASTDGTGAAAGQYITIPVHAASYLPNALTVIPSMQGFFVHTNAATTLNLDYNKAVYTPALTKVFTTPTRAPQTTNHKLQTTNVESMIRLHVSGFGSEDEVYLLEGEEFSRAFENGWDGRKVKSEKSAVSMAVLSPDGQLAVAALPQLDGTEILFEGGNHKTYTITISLPLRGEPEGAFLLDKESGEYTELTEGATYTFKCGAEPRRFVITKRGGQMEDNQTAEEIAPYKFIQNGILYIRLGDRLYDGTGLLLK